MPPIQHAHPARPLAIPKATSLSDLFCGGHFDERASSSHHHHHHKSSRHLGWRRQVGWRQPLAASASQKAPPIANAAIIGASAPLQPPLRPRPQSLRAPLSRSSAPPRSSCLSHFSARPLGVSPTLGTPLCLRSSAILALWMSLAPSRVGPVQCSCASSSRLLGCFVASLSTRLAVARVPAPQTPSLSTLITVHIAAADNSLSFHSRHDPQSTVRYQ